MTKPPRLRHGDTVGVIAPGGAVVNRPALERGVAALEALGYRVRLAASVKARQGYLAGSEALRRDDVTAMFTSPDVRAIFCARGGYGVTRLLPLLDPLALARHPKIFVGYSDVSPLLVSLVQRGRMVAFHGPMVAADFGADDGDSVGLDEQSRSQLVGVLSEGSSLEVTIPRVMRSGVARGTLIGGCLSLLAATAGTPYAVRGDGAILFLEDVGEAEFRIDRMLTQLHQSGAFAGMRGLVFGTMVACGWEGSGVQGLASLLDEWAARLGIPVGAGLPSGHNRPNITLPFGLEAELVLNGREGVLRVAEASVE